MNDASDHVTETTIVEGLARLAITPTCSVMVHASLSRFGHVEGGAETVVAGLRQAAGDQGAVIIPSFRDSIRSDHYALRQCATTCPQTLCPSREPGFTGKIGETLREQGDAVRSCHPTHSWVGVGSGATELLEGHRHSATPCGRESPFIRLMRRDGILLLLGVDVNAVTNFHVIEDALNVPYLSAIDPPRRHATYTTGGRRIQYCYPELLHASLESTGIVRSNTIGQATCHAIRAREFGAFLWVAGADDPWCFVLRPRGEVYDPQTDARLKTQRMAEAWRGNPDGDAWQQLIAAANAQAEPNQFEPTSDPRTDCPAYRGVIRDHPRCAANDIPPWESFDAYGPDEPGVATCQQCNWCPSG